MSLQIGAQRGARKRRLAAIARKYKDEKMIQKDMLQQQTKMHTIPSPPEFTKNWM